MQSEACGVSESVGQIGMEDEESITDRHRWADALDKMAMALNEAGYPTTTNAYSFVKAGRENELVFHDRFPPREVALRAAELCGVRDLMELAEVDAVGWEMGP